MIATELEEKDTIEVEVAAEANASIKIMGDVTRTANNFDLWWDQNDLLVYLTIFCIVLLISIMSSPDKSFTTPTILNVNTLLETIEYNAESSKEFAGANNFIDSAEAIHQVIQRSFQYGQHIFKQAPEHLSFIKATVKEAFVLTLTEVEDAILLL